MVRHFIVQGSRVPRAWDPRNPGSDLVRDCVYFGQVLAEMESHLDGEEDIDCYLTWYADALPEYGPHVVAVLVGEECGIVPRYARHVRMVARVMSRYPFLGIREWWPFSKLKLALLAKYARNWSLHLRSWWDYLRPPASWPPRVRDRAAIVHIPWGSAFLGDVPMKSITERSTQYMFSGQVNQGGLVKRLSRGSLLAAIEELERKYPHLSGNDTVRVHAAGTLGLTDKERYADKLMNSRICLAPRGSVADTWRYFEGIKSGCVVLTNPLPNEWYYRDAPVIQLQDWSDLEDVLLPLLEDVSRMEELHEKTLRYWGTVCGDKAVGRYLASNLSKNKL